MTNYCKYCGLSTCCCPSPDELREMATLLEGLEVRRPFDRLPTPSGRGLRRACFGRGLRRAGSAERSGEPRPAIDDSKGQHT